MPEFSGFKHEVLHTGSTILKETTMNIGSIKRVLTNRYRDCLLQQYCDDAGNIVVVEHTIKSITIENGKYVIELYDAETIEITEGNDIHIYPVYNLGKSIARRKHDDGDKFSTEEFHEMVECGGFIDYDGSGTPYNETKDIVFPGYFNVNQLAAMKYNPEVTHILWYNQ